MGDARAGCARRARGALGRLRLLLERLRRGLRARSDAEADASVVDDATAGEDTEDDETGVDAPDVPEEDITPDTTPGPNIDLEAGRADYETFCGFCHGDDGEGYLADNANALSNAHFLASASDEFLRLSTIYGRPGTPMSPWGEVQGGP